MGVWRAVVHLVTERAFDGAGVIGMFHVEGNALFGLALAHDLVHSLRRWQGRGVTRPRGERLGGRGARG